MKTTVVIAAGIVALFVLAACGGGGGGQRSGPVDAATTNASGYQRNNVTAEDLRDHWNEAAPARLALGSGAVPTDAAERKDALSSLIAGANGDRLATGTILRNIQPRQIDVIGDRGGITYGQWKGGPAGTMNIEFQYLPAEPDREPLTARAALKARIERAGKAWSYRLLDDFEPRLVPASVRRLGRNHLAAYPVSDMVADDLLIEVFYAGDYGYSSALYNGAARLKQTETDFEPHHGVLFQAPGDHWESAWVITHEIGHVLGHEFREGVGPRSAERYVNRQDHTFEGPNAMAANGGKPVPFQRLDEHRNPVSTGGEVDYGHLGPCEMIMAYGCPRSTPAELDFAVLEDIGYELLDAETASRPELYGYAAWGQWSAWGVGVERSLDWEHERDTLAANADAFGVSPTAALGDSALSGRATWTGSLLGVDIGDVRMPPVFGDAELGIELGTLDGTAVFDNLTVSAEGVNRAFRAARLQYSVSVAGNGFADNGGRVAGGFYGPNHEEMAGVLHDTAPNVSLVAGFGGLRK